MKITKRMRKLLLILLHPERMAPFVSQNFPRFTRRFQSIIGYNACPRWLIMSFCLDSEEEITHSKRTSFSRTFRILEKLGLIEWKQFLKAEGYLGDGYCLTSEGRETALKIEKEILDIFEEYQSLVSPNLYVFSH